MPQTETVEILQKPQPRTLSFTRPNNIRGSAHGKISAYQELWELVEKHRYQIFIADNMLEYGLAYNNAVNIQSHIRDRLKELGCTNFNTFQQWTDK